MIRSLLLAIALLSVPVRAEEDKPVMEELPGGAYYLNALGYEKLNLEFARLQRKETQQGAENTQLREELAREQAELRPTTLGWVLVVGASMVAGALVGGFVIFHQVR